MEGPVILESVLLGVGLAAACGLRVFVPLLVLSVASRCGAVPLAGGFEWIGSWPAVLLLATATVLEVAAFYVPWLDNLLDVLAAPAAVLAGVLAVASTMGDADPVLRWTLAAVAGGGAAGSVHLLTAAGRGASSVTTAGAGNVLVATLENLGALLISLLSVLLPLLAVLAAAGIVLFGVHAFRRVRGGRRSVRAG